VCRKLKNNTRKNATFNSASPDRQKFANFLEILRVCRKTAFPSGLFICSIWSVFLAAVLRRVLISFGEILSQSVFPAPISLFLLWSCSNTPELVARTTPSTHTHTHTHTHVTRALLLQIRSTKSLFLHSFKGESHKTSGSYFNPKSKCIFTLT